MCSGSAFFDLDAVVEDDDVGPAAELLAGDGFEQGQAHALLGRRRAGVDVEDGQPGLVLELAAARSLSWAATSSRQSVRYSRTASQSRSVSVSSSTASAGKPSTSCRAASKSATV